MLKMFYFIVVVLFLLYAIFILYYRAGWEQLPEYKLIRDYNAFTKVTILIPARNEEQHLKQLLDDITNQYFPPELMEIIVIDDHSTDNTASIARSYKRVQYISLSDYLEEGSQKAYKKKAIETGIANSSGELIITTDADCRLCNYWLLSIVQYYETYHPALLAAPVLFTAGNHWFEQFQSIDFMTMQGITGALAATRSGTMCNGANLAYTRKAFLAVNGFNGIDHIASGDDMLLMYKIEQQFPGKTTYLKCTDAIVYTNPMPDFKSFINQRTRWASKAGHFEDKRIQSVLLIVYLFNLLFPLLLILSIFHLHFLVSFFILCLLKSGLELMLLIPVSNFFRKRKELTYFFLLQFIHIPYILYAGLKGQLGTYQWKERTVR